MNHILQYMFITPENRLMEGTHVGTPNLAQML